MSETTMAAAGLEPVDDAELQSVDGGFWMVVAAVAIGLAANGCRDHGAKGVLRPLNL